MEKLLKNQRLIPKPQHTWLAGWLLLVFIACNSGFAYDRYNDGCMECHGAFTDGTSPKGTEFPSNNKHTMHRSSSHMNTDCDLCHTAGDDRNPYIGSSDGTDNTAGLGCTGCHVAVGLRAHHAVNGETTCAICHPGDGTPIAENINPPYYGSVDTDADNSCNDVLASKNNENWSVGDFVGLDNDGDNLYDLADFDCGPAYQIATIAIEGDNVRISWDTVGGRRDMLQSTPSLTDPFSDVGSALSIPGVGVVTTNGVEVGGLTASNRFYRIRYAP